MRSWVASAACLRRRSFVQEYWRLNLTPPCSDMWSTEDRQRRCPPSAIGKVGIETSSRAFHFTQNWLRFGGRGVGRGCACEGSHTQLSHRSGLPFGRAGERRSQSCDLPGGLRAKNISPSRGPCASSFPQNTPIDCRHFNYLWAHPPHSRHATTEPVPGALNASFHTQELRE
jgi:hypothetical protein